MLIVSDGHTRRQDDSGRSLWIEPLIGIRDGLLDLERTHVIGIAIPMSGPAGMLAPSCIASAQLAIAEINSDRGIMGTRLEILYLDADHQRAPHLQSEIKQLLDHKIISGIASFGTTEIRERLKQTIAGRVPHVFAAPFNGVERSPNVYTIGLSALEQLAPAVPRLTAHLKAKRWAIISSDRAWPDHAKRIGHRAIIDAGGTIVFEHRLRGRMLFDPNVIDDIAKAKPDVVFSALSGQEEVDFHRAFSHAGLDKRAFRFSEMVEENTLLACGPEATDRLISAGPYFPTLSTDRQLSFLERYRSMHGIRGPTINMFAQSVYEGIQFYSSLVERNATGQRGPISFRTARGGVYHSNLHKEDPVYLAEADGLQFRVLETLAV